MGYDAKASHFQQKCSLQLSRDPHSEPILSAISIMTPLPLNSFSISGIICMSLMTAFGIGSIVCTALLWNMNDWDIGAISCGLCFLVAAIIAYPLTYVGAQCYMDQQSSTAMKGLMITAWVFYGIMIVNGIAMVLVVVMGWAIGMVWVIFEVLWALVGWIMMFVHAEVARKLPIWSVLPLTTMVYHTSPVNLDYGWFPNTWYTTKTSINEDGTQTREITTYSKNPDGSVTVV